MQTSTIFCPVLASEARKMVAEKLFTLIPVSRFPRRIPLKDAHGRLAYFAVTGTDAAFAALATRAGARMTDALADGRPMVLDVMTPMVWAS